VRTVGAVLVVHAGWYFATGTWHGYGDGALVYHLLGDARHAAAIAGGVVTCVAAFVGARDLFRTIVATMPARRFAGVAIAMVVAAAVNAGLAIGELSVRHDTMYGAIMTTERDRTIQRDYARWLAEAGAVDDVARERELRQLERDHRTFPFAWLLGACVAGSAVAGAWRSRAPLASSAVSGRAVAVAAGVAAASIAAVVVLDRVLGV
jgi:hypothetical protein